jgi:hypothetical protein
MQFQNRFINVDILFSDAQECGSWGGIKFLLMNPMA